MSRAARRIRYPHNARLDDRDVGDSNDGGATRAVVAARVCDRVITQLRSLLAALAGSPYRRRLGLLAAGIVLVICANSVGQVWLNAWQGGFFDTIEHRDLAAFGSQLLVFGQIVSGLLVLVVAQTWLKEMFQVRLREWVTHDLLDRWLAPKRAYLLTHAGEIGANPDQRVHEDTRHLIDLSDRPRRRLAAILAAPHQLRRRALGAVGQGRASRSAIAAS